jgi:hypothetical protein
VRADRILREAFAVGPDPLHLAKVFQMDDSTAVKYSTVARQLLAEAPERE